MTMGVEAQELTKGVFLSPFVSTGKQVTGSSLEEALELGATL